LDKFFQEAVQIGCPVLKLKPTRFWFKIKIRFFWLRSHQNISGRANVTKMPLKSWPFSKNPIQIFHQYFHGDFCTSPQDFGLNKFSVCCISQITAKNIFLVEQILETFLSKVRTPYVRSRPWFHILKQPKR